jgi:hypothetical protein
MKNNSRALVISVIGIIIIVGAMVFVGRDLIQRADEGGFFQAPSQGSRETVRLNPDVEPFSSLSLEGAWDVSVEGGENYSVELEVSEYAADEVVVSSTGGMLRLGVDTLRIGPSLRLRASIVVPALSRIEASGGTNLELSDLNLDELTVISEGASNVEADDVELGNLVLESDGAANMDFSDAEVRNARVRISGAGNIEVNMAGGSLTGSLEGVGRLAYSGEVSEEDVEVDGLGTVRRSD